MITKGERTSRNPFEQDLVQDEHDTYGQEGESHHPFSMGDSPPTYDDPNYIPSPTSNSRSNTAALMPLVPPQATGSTTSGPRSNSTTTTTTATPMYLMSPEVETEWNRALHELERNMSSLQAARTRAAQPKQADAEETAREVRAVEECVLGNMRRLALIHPDPRVQAEWHARAEVFMRTMSAYRPPPDDDNDDDQDIEASTSSNAGAARGYKEESYTDPEYADNDDFIIDRQRSRLRPQQRGEGGSGSGLAALSASSPSASSFSSKAKRMLVKATEDDKGLSYIKKGTAGIFLAPIAISGALLYGTAAVLYGAGKGAVHLGKKAAGAATNASSSSSRSGVPTHDPVQRSMSYPELVSPARSTFKGDTSRHKDI